MKSHETMPFKMHSLSKMLMTIKIHIFPVIFHIDFSNFPFSLLFVYIIWICLHLFTTDDGENIVLEKFSTIQIAENALANIDIRNGAVAIGNNAKIIIKQGKLKHFYTST